MGGSDNLQQERAQESVCREFKAPKCWPPLPLTLPDSLALSLSPACAGSPARSRCQVFQGHFGPGRRRLPAHTQEVDAQQEADGKHAEHQPPLERHRHQGARPALRRT